MRRLDSLSLLEEAFHHPLHSHVCLMAVSYFIGSYNLLCPSFPPLITKVYHLHISEIQFNEFTSTETNPLPLAAVVLKKECVCLASCLIECSSTTEE